MGKISDKLIKSGRFFLVKAYLFFKKMFISHCAFNLKIGNYMIINFINQINVCVT